MQKRHSPLAGLAQRPNRQTRGPRLGPERPKLWADAKPEPLELADSWGYKYTLHHREKDINSTL